MKPWSAINAALGTEVADDFGKGHFGVQKGREGSFTEIVPVSGLTPPERIRMSVDLPAPFSPISPTTSCAPTTIVALRKALTGPKLLLTFSTFSTNSPI